MGWFNLLRNGGSVYDRNSGSIWSGLCTLPTVTQSTGRREPEQPVAPQTIQIDKIRIKAAAMVADELESVCLEKGGQHTLSIYTLTLLTPTIPFVVALWAAYRKLTGVPNHLTDVRCVIRGISKAAYLLGFLEIPIQDISRRHIKLCLELCSKFNPRWSNYRHNRYRDHLLALFKQLVGEDAVVSNIIRDIFVLKKKQSIRDVLSNSELIRIDRYLYKENYNFWRFMRLFYYSGGRETEMMRLTERSINLEKREYRVWVWKGRKYKEVIRPIPVPAVPLWKELLTFCRPDQFLFSKFLEPGDKPIRADQIGRRWTRYVKRQLGIRCGFYCLKYLYSDRIAEVFDLQHAQLQNSHADVSTTAIYAVGEQRRMLERLKAISIPFTYSTVTNPLSREGGI